MTIKATRVISGALALLGAVLLGIISQQASASENTPLMERVGLGSERGECLIVDVSEESAVSQEEIDNMVAAGFVGDPSDGEEALHSADCYDGQAPYTVRISMYVVGTQEPTPLNDVDSDATDLTVVGQVEIPTEQGDTVVVEYDGELTHIRYADGSTDTVSTPLNSDHMDNMRESLGKGCKAKDMYEDYSCKAPSTSFAPKPAEKATTSGNASTSGIQAPTDKRADVLKAESARLLAATQAYAPKAKK